MSSATPSCVAVLHRTTIRLTVTAGGTGFSVDEGDATLTSLDVVKPSHDKDAGYFKRFENGGLLLTRCGVQVAAAASAERMLGRIALGGPGPAPLPSASIGVLTVEHIKHSREKVLDCAFAEAFGLSCDAIASEKGAAPAAGCQGGYAKVLEHIAKAASAQELPPGSPSPRPSASP